MPRFDVSLTSELQSRDGSLSREPFIKNGFAEAGGQEQPTWNWQRPALTTGTNAPISGAGLGLYFVGTVLWGIYHNGTTTATSATITVGGSPPPPP